MQISPRFSDDQADMIKKVANGLSGSIITDKLLIDAAFDQAKEILKFSEYSDIFSQSEIIKKPKYDILISQETNEGVYCSFLLFF